MNAAKEKAVGSPIQGPYLRNFQIHLISYHSDILEKPHTHKNTILMCHFAQSTCELLVTRQALCLHQYFFLLFLLNANQEFIKKKPTGTRDILKGNKAKNCISTHYLTKSKEDVKKFTVSVNAIFQYQLYMLTGE